MPTLSSITRSDWSPYIRQAAYAIGAAIALTYTAGLLTGEAVHHWNDQLAAWVSGRAATLTPAAPARVIVQRQAMAPAPVLSRRSECQRLRARGMTQQQIADALGCSRTTVRRELAA
jgi:DNA-binding NarL/FixJ family response regulator